MQIASLVAFSAAKEKTRFFRKGDRPVTLKNKERFKMKQIYRFLLISLLLLACITPAYSALTNSGFYSSKDSGSYMDIINTKSGVIEAERSKFLKIVNHGKIELDRCGMLEIVESSGLLTANHTTFHKDVIISGGNTNLNSCRLENLYISDIRSDNNSDNEYPPQLTLRGQTMIKGSVIFKTGEAVIYKGRDVVIRGEIINGNILDLHE